MASEQTRCPDCESEIDLDGYDLDEGESINCPECIVPLIVTSLVPVTVKLDEE